MWFVNGTTCWLVSADRYAKNFMGSPRARSPDSRCLRSPRSHPPRSAHITVERGQGGIRGRGRAPGARARPFAGGRRARATRVANITLFIFGGVSSIAKEASTASVEFLIAVVGPLIGLGLAGLFWVL